MSLLNVDITKKKRLSLKEVKLPEVERRVDPTPIQVERPPTAEEITYSKFTALNPAVERLVEKLDLVSTVTGERIRKIDLSGIDITPQEPPKTATVEKVQDEPKEAKKSQKIGDIALRIITPISNLSKEEIITRLMEETKVNRERAEKGFNLMIETGVITATNVGTYYLTGSTPF